MTCEWKLRAETVVEDRLSSDPVGGSDWFVSDELNEIFAMVETVVLRVDGLPEDEKRFKESIDALAECMP